MMEFWRQITENPLISDHACKLPREMRTGFLLSSISRDHNKDRTMLKIKEKGHGDAITLC